MEIMGSSLGDFNISQSSSVDVKNIKWTQKNSRDTDKPKKKKTRKFPSTNVIHATKMEVRKTAKIFKIKENDKSTKKKTDKKIQSSSASTCKIKPGFRRPGR